MAYAWVGAPVPAEVLALAHTELSIGAKRMLETCVLSNRARCLTSGTHAPARRRAQNNTKNTVSRLTACRGCALRAPLTAW